MFVYSDWRFAGFVECASFFPCEIKTGGYLCKNGRYRGPFSLLLVS